MAKFDLTRVDVEDFLRALRIRNLERADYENWRFSCPFAGHVNGDMNASAYMHDENTAFFCHGCKRHGNAITFLAEYEDVPFMEARRWLREEYGADFKEPEGGSMRSEWESRFRDAGHAEEERQTYLDESVLQRYDVDWADAWCTWEGMARPAEGAMGYMFRRGFEPETLMDWEVGFYEEGQRFTIPVRDEDGRLVGFKARAWERDREPKYLSLGDKPDRPAKFGFPTHEKSLIVFGLDRAKSTGRLIVVEGELNCMAMHQKGYHDAVAISGSYLSDAQALLIREHCDEVVLFFDSLRDDGTRDQAGHEALWGAKRKRNKRRPGAVDLLEPHLKVLIAPDHHGDPADMDQDEVDACVEMAEGSVKVRTRVRFC